MVAPQGSPKFRISIPKLAPTPARLTKPYDAVSIVRTDPFPVLGNIPLAPPARIEYAQSADRSAESAQLRTYGAPRS
jgi:hypothetical protein